jgi:small-conductance mechanosensitive channel
MEFLNALKQSFLGNTAFWTKVTSVLPNFLAALVLLVAGHFLGKLIAFLVSRLLKRVGLDKLSESAGLGGAAAQTGFDTRPSALLGKIVYWLILLIFIISAADTLGLSTVSDTINNFVLYLPKVIAAFLVIIFGLFVAQLLRSGVEAALSSINLGYERVVGNLIYAILVVVVVSLGIGQLEIETDLLNQVVSIILLAAAASVALALGLGTRDVAGNIVAGVYARDLYEPGSMVRFGDVSGRIIEVGATSVVIEVSADKTVTVPNRRLLEEQVEIGPDA